MRVKPSVCVVLFVPYYSSSRLSSSRLLGERKPEVVGDLLTKAIPYTNGTSFGNTCNATADRFSLRFVSIRFYLFGWN